MITDLSDDPFHSWEAYKSKHPLWCEKYGVSLRVGAVVQSMFRELFPKKRLAISYDNPVQAMLKRPYIDPPF